MLLTTANICNRPRMRQSRVEADIARAKRYSTVIGWQEIGPRRYKRAVRTAGDGHYAHAHLELDVPISYDLDRYTLIDSGRVRAHKGRATASPARWLTWVLLADAKVPGLRFVVINTHFVSGAWNAKSKPFKSWRRRKWLVHFAALQRLVDRFVAAELPVLITGDFNRLNLPVLHANARVLSGHGIDKVILVTPQHASASVRFLDVHTYGGYSDHPQRTVRLRIRSLVPYRR